MIPRERVMTALRRGQPDMVPWLENDIEEELQVKVMGGQHGLHARRFVPRTRHGRLRLSLPERRKGDCRPIAADLAHR